MMEIIQTIIEIALVAIYLGTPIYFFHLWKEHSHYPKRFVGMMRIPEDDQKGRLFAKMSLLACVFVASTIILFGHFSRAGWIFVW